MSRKPLVHILSQGQGYSFTVSAIGRWLNGVCWVKEGIKLSNGKSNRNCIWKEALFPKKWSSYAEHFTGDASLQSKNMKSKGVTFVGSLAAVVPAGTKSCRTFRLSWSRRFGERLKTAMSFHFVPDVHPVDTIPVPSSLHLITAQSATFSAGAPFNYHFDLEKKEKKKGSGVIDKNAKVRELNELKFWHEELLKLYRLDPLCYCHPPWVVNGLRMTLEVLRIF